MDIILNSQGEPYPLVQEGHLPLAAWPVSGRIVAQKAFQTELCPLCRSHGESQQSAYSSVWRCWCDQQEADPVSAPLNMVLDYLTELYEVGKQYRTINTARSAISMTYDPVNGWKVGQHPLTIQFLKGIFNHRPPAPRYTTVPNPIQRVGKKIISIWKTCFSGKGRQPLHT